MKFKTTILRTGLLATLAALMLDACADPGVPAAAAQPAASTPAPAAVPAPARAPASAPLAALPVGQQVTPLAAPQPRHRRVKSSDLSEADVERAALLWSRNGQAAGVVGDNGTVMYGYGESRPIIHCAPLHLCVIKLMHGESITDIGIGDKVRWKVITSHAGDMPVVVVKTVAVGLETNLTVLTDAGRVYYMILRSVAQGALFFQRPGFGPVVRCITVHSPPK